MFTEFKDFSENEKIMNLFSELNLLFNCINKTRGDKVSFLQKELKTHQAIIRSIDSQFQTNIIIEQNVKDGKLYQTITFSDLGVVMALDIRVGDVVSVTNDFNNYCPKIIDIHYEKRLSDLKKITIIPNILAEKLNFYFEVLNIPNWLDQEFEKFIKLNFINNIFDFYEISYYFFKLIEESSHTNRRAYWSNSIKRDIIKDIQKTRTTEFQKNWISEEIFTGFLLKKI